MIEVSSSGADDAAAALLVPRFAIRVSGSGCSAGFGGPIVERCNSSLAVTTGQGSGEANISITIPKPNVNVSRSRVVIALLAGTVSSSGPVHPPQHLPVRELGQQLLD